MVNLPLSKPASSLFSINFLNTKDILALGESEDSALEVNKGSRYSTAPSRLLLEEEKNGFGLVPNVGSLKPIKQVHECFILLLH